MKANFRVKKTLTQRRRDRRGTPACYPPSAEGVGRQSFYETNQFSRSQIGFSSYFVYRVRYGLLENFLQKVLCASAFVNIFSFLVLPVPSGACPVQVLI